MRITNRITPLYNYLKPYPEKLKQQFYDAYGDENLIAKETASPVLGALNSGMQLYRLKYEQPATYSHLKFSLHLPQYLSFVISSQTASEITSIGCHTQLWDFKKNSYHEWVYKENLDVKFPPIFQADKIIHTSNNASNIAVGIGLHDSSAALIPYLKLFTEPFILLTTGTWCISLNPFNHSTLTDYELNYDCLCYLSYEGKPVKASRLFAGYQHEQQVKRLAEHFNKDLHYYKTIMHDNLISEKLNGADFIRKFNDVEMFAPPGFETRSLNDFKTYEQAYYQLMIDIVAQQVFSTKLVLDTTIQRIFVDGGFSKNDVYMHLLAAAFPGIKIYAANVAQASSLGAALVLNKDNIPANLIELKYYEANNNI